MQLIIGKQLVPAGTSFDQLEEALSTQINVAHSTIMLLQVHKPGRFTLKELSESIKRQQESK